MAALTADKDLQRKEGKLESFLVEDNVHIYKGAIVALNAAGYLIPAADAANNTVAGLAYERCDNTLTGHTQGGKSCRVLIGGVALLMASSITQAMVGEAMYVVDDATVDDVVGTNGIKAGVLLDYVSATSGWVRMASGKGRAPVSADASDLATAITLVNEIKAILQKYVA